MVTEVTDDTFRLKLESGSMLVLKLYAEWCGSCQLMAAGFERLSEMPEFTGIEFLKADAEKNAFARKSAGIHYLPFFAVYRNKMLVKSVSLQSVDQLENFIKDAFNLKP